MSEVKLPALGESVTEGTVTRWLKKIGDTVAIDEPLVEVSTDKVDTEIPSPVAGVLQQILVQEDETAAVGAVLAIVADGVAQSAPVTSAPPTAEPAPQPVISEPAPVATPVVETPVVAAPVAQPVVAAPVATPPMNLPIFTPQVNQVPAAPIAAATPSAPVTSGDVSDSVYVTPLVRKLAQDTGVDLNSVKGTGIGGRIRREDVLAAASQAKPAAVNATPVSVPVAAERGTSEPMSRLRKVLAERAVASMVSTAQLTTVVEVDVTRIASLRSKVQAEFTAKAGVKLNFMPFFFLAAAEALRAHPKINASIDGENILYHASENISFAVDTDRGLLTPVIRDSASLSLSAIAQQIADLAARTRDNKLDGADASRFLVAVKTRLEEANFESNFGY